MTTKIPPNLKKLAELTSNSDLKIDESILTQPQQKPSPNHKTLNTYNQPPYLQPLPNSENPEHYIALPQQEILISNKRFHFRKDWFQSHSLLNQISSAMPNLLAFWQRYFLLRDNKAENGLGKLILRDEQRRLFKELKNSKNWTAEWLDADFKYNEQTKLYTLNTNHRTLNTKLTPLTSEPLETCLMENTKIDLSTLNSQAMPTTQGEDIYYGCLMPDNNSVAGFDAGSDRAGLDCFWDPRDSNSALGVRKIFSTGNRG